MTRDLPQNWNRAPDLEDRMGNEVYRFDGGYPAFLVELEEDHDQTNVTARLEDADDSVVLRSENYDRTSKALREARRLMEAFEAIDNWYARLYDEHHPEQ